MRLVVGQFLLLSLVLAVSGQKWDCWYILCDDKISDQVQQTFIVSRPVEQYQPQITVPSINYYQSQPATLEPVPNIVKYNVQLQDNTANTLKYQYQPSIKIQLQNRDQIQTNPVHYYSEPAQTLENVKYYSQQPSYSQGGAWIVNQQVAQTQNAPTFDVNQQNLVNIQQPIVSQGGAWVASQQPSQSQQGTWTINQQPKQTWIVDQKPSQEAIHLENSINSQTSQSQSWLVNPQPYQAQDNAWIISQPSQTQQVPKVEANQQSNHLLQNFVISQQPSQSQVLSSVQPSVPASDKFDFYYQEPNRFLVNFVSYPVQEPVQSQESAVNAPQPGQVVVNCLIPCIEQEIPVNVNSVKLGENLAKPVNVTNHGSDSANVNSAKPGEILRNPVIINNHQFEQDAKPLKPQVQTLPSQSPVNAANGTIHQSGQGLVTPPMNFETGNNTVTVVDQPTQSQDKTEVNKSETVANQR